MTPLRTWDDDRVGVIFWDGVLDVDPTSATIVLELTSPDGAITVYPCAWQGDAVQDGARWRRTAATSTIFVGTSVTPTGAQVRLTAGWWRGQFHATVGDAVIPAQAFRFAVE
ncbi:MAG: hypothetical protein KBG77_06170 [Dermatophilaceae bacterium]|nr:hypothetical protein [Dermatophilaceae bacterium]